MHASLTFLGTGNALVTRCYNTCFVLDSDADRLLVDAGGGNGILRQLEAAQIDIATVHHLFITHAHTDHLVGCLWVVRLFVQRSMAGKCSGTLHIYSHEKPLRVLRYMCEQMLTSGQAKTLQAVVEWHELADGDHFAVGKLRLQVFDIHSAKERQFGFVALLPDGQRLVCLGDEPYNELCHDYALGADWLLSEAFCLYADRERFKPYEKNHSTALDAARLATTLGAKHLVLYHTEDHTLATRKAAYTAEAQREYGGPVFVPNDLERIELR